MILTGRDIFQRANSPTLGGNWSAITDWAQIVSQRARATTLSSPADVLATIFSPQQDQYARVVLGDFAGIGYGSITTIVRAVGPQSLTYIGAMAEKNNTDETTMLFKVVAGTFTPMAVENSNPWQANDSLELSAIGTSPTRYVVKRNDIPILSTTDTDPQFNSGLPGFRIHEFGDLSQATVAAFMAGSPTTFSFAWNANPAGDNVLFYNLYAGLASNLYTNVPESPKSMGNNTSGTFTVAGPGTYFWALTAINQTAESTFSNQLTGSVGLPALFPSTVPVVAPSPYPIRAFVG